MRKHWEECWRFETANLVVVFEVTDCEDDPADSFCEDSDVEAVRNGGVVWFDARVRVLLSDGQELGADYLGACAYNSVREFYTSHRDRDPMNRNCSIMRAANGQNVCICHYFPSMVSEAVSSARQALGRIRGIAVRAA